MTNQFTVKYQFRILGTLRVFDPLFDDINNQFYGMGGDPNITISSKTVLAEPILSVKKELSKQQLDKCRELILETALNAFKSSKNIEVELIGRIYGD